MTFSEVVIGGVGIILMLIAVVGIGFGSYWLVQSVWPDITGKPSGKERAAARNGGG